MGCKKQSIDIDPFEFVPGPIIPELGISCDAISLNIRYIEHRLPKGNLAFTRKEYYHLHLNNDMIIQLANHLECHPYFLLHNLHDLVVTHPRSKDKFIITTNPDMVNGYTGCYWAKIELTKINAQCSDIENSNLDVFNDLAAEKLAKDMENLKQSLSKPQKPK